uniref:Uncharacterized protein n=1 Tax=Meloidogyne enterolobii TaxID=390850 RepID=A0A6V7Y119_MELEN|nr:unnamed protein product [Meloidogyne enterolobii]
MQITDIPDILQNMIYLQIHLILANHPISIFINPLFIPLTLLYPSIVSRILNRPFNPYKSTEFI